MRCTCKTCKFESYLESEAPCAVCDGAEFWEQKEKEDKKMDKTCEKVHVQCEAEEIKVESIAAVLQDALNVLYNASDALRSLEFTVIGDKNLPPACTATAGVPENLTENIDFIHVAANNLYVRLIALSAGLNG